MGHLTRDMGELMDSMRPAAYVSDRGWSYRLLPGADGAWRIYPDPVGDLAWLGPGWPGYVAIPQAGGGYAVYRAGGREPVGYAQNLSDMCWPAERDLIATRPLQVHHTPEKGGI